MKFKPENFTQPFGGYYDVERQSIMFTPAQAAKIAQRLYDKELEDAPVVYTNIQIYDGGKLAEWESEWKLNPEGEQIKKPSAPFPNRKAKLVEITKIT